MTFGLSANENSFSLVTLIDSLAPRQTAPTLPPCNSHLHLHDIIFHIDFIATLQFVLDQIDPSFGDTHIATSSFRRLSRRLSSLLLPTEALQDHRKFELCPSNSQQEGSSYHGSVLACPDLPCLTKQHHQTETTRPTISRTKTFPARHPARPPPHVLEVQRDGHNLKTAMPTANGSQQIAWNCVILIVRDAR